MSSQKSTATMTTITIPSSAIYSRQCMAQNYLLIWVDSNIDETNNDCQNMLAQLQTVVTDVNIFTQPDQGIDLLTDVDDMKVFLIVAGTISQKIVPLIHDIPHLDVIYIYCRNKSKHELWTKKWVKVRGVHTCMADICESLQKDVKQSNENAISMSFIGASEEAFNQNLNQLEPTFMYTQIFKEILLGMEYDQHSTKSFGVYCRTLYHDNTYQISIINEFERDYQSTLSIWWYTRECFTYQMLNRALRTLEADTIIIMGFFLRDLHQQIEQLYHQQISTYDGKSFLVYRGQGLSNADFEKLQKTKGGLLSFNNFLSTSNNREVSLRFAKHASTKIDTVGILFQMSINPSIKSAPFASIRDVSYFKTEEEILFSMHTVFRIGEITQIDNSIQLYQMNLRLTSDDDPQLRTLTDRIREEAGGGTGWDRLGNLLFKIGQFSKAEELYNVLLQRTTGDRRKAIYYHQLGRIKDSLGDYNKAMWYHEKGLEIQENILPTDDPSLAASYGNIGLVYLNMAKYSKALSFYEKALEIFQKTPPPDHPELATYYNNIGQVYKRMGEYSKALSFYEKALEIGEKTLPPNHPHLAISYASYGSVYCNMKEYSKARSFYEKALEICQKTLPPNHPHMASCYNNIGEVYKFMGEYSKALSFYEKACEIFKKTLSPNHPELAISYNNIGSVYKNMKEYSKALSFYEKVLEICQKTLPPNHPDLAIFYNNIGAVYRSMREYPQALSFYEKELEIRQKTLPSNYRHLAASYSNIAFVYANMGNSSKVLSYLERILNIYQTSLPPNHPDIIEARVSIELVKKSIDNV